MKKQQIVVITGASRGMGYATAKSFCEWSGSKVIAIARSEEGLKKLREECRDMPGELHTIRYDLAKLSEGNELQEAITNLVPHVDILINNAGFLAYKGFAELTEEELDMMYTINLKAPFLLIQSLLPMFSKDSHIINISSMGGVQGSIKFPGLSGYSATKGGLSILTEALAAEFVDLGIKVNCLAPGAVQTEMLAQAFPEFKAPVTPEEMGEFIRDFAAKGHKFFNSKVLPVSVSTP